MIKTKEYIDDESILISRLDNRLKPKGKKYRIIDLFSGAGGMTLGFSKFFNHSFTTVWANDINKFAVDTYNLNFGKHCVLGDINDILSSGKSTIPDADIVIGGPPCQGFSLLNKNRDNDSRKSLWIPFLKVVEMSGADLFLMENVPQLLGSPEYLEIKKAAESSGFIIRSAKLCAADYGVPQTRWRVFIIGCKFTDPEIYFPPKKTHFNGNNGVGTSLSGFNHDYIKSPEKWRTVRDAIEDLPYPVGTEIRDEKPPLNIHFGRTPTEVSLKRYKILSKEGMNRFDLQRLAPELTPDCWIRKKSGGTDLLGRLWWNKPAFTIRTEFYKPEKGRYLHPKQHRPITHREAARIQTFPDEFIFCGTKIEIAKQIGNAVPPMLAARLADCIYGIMQFRK